MTPLTLIYLSLGAKCLNTLCTVAPSRIVCHLSEHLKLTLAVEEEQVVLKCNKMVSSYKSSSTGYCILREQLTTCWKEALCDLRLLVFPLSYVSLLLFLFITTFYYYSSALFKTGSFFF